MLDFTDNVKMVQKKDERLFNIDTNRIYIILNKFCNSKITKDQIISKKFESDITNAIKILNSHGYEHGDTHLGNVVDCGESSDPRYKLIDFGLMDRTSRFTNDVEYFISNIHTFHHDDGASAPKSEEHEGGQIRYKFKRSRRRKTRTKTKSKFKSKSKSKNKRRTRRK
jgi:predicted unusual protein kinase regulating ubiquinone biosynthesis (AarF/ABC1/UbiB family)